MKPETALLIGVGMYFLTMILQRFLGERNFKSLSPEDKTKLVDQFSSHRSLATYLPIAIMAGVIGAVYFELASFRWLFPVAVVSVLAVSLVVQLSILRHLGSLGLPGEYVSRFRIQSIVVQVGNVISLAMLAYGISMMA